jgi:hypothetical protein
LAGSKPRPLKEGGYRTLLGWSVHRKRIFVKGEIVTSIGVTATSGVVSGVLAQGWEPRWELRFRWQGGGVGEEAGVVAGLGG